MAIKDHLRCHRHRWSGGPSMAAIFASRGAIHSNIFYRRWSRGTYFGGTICGMTEPYDIITVNPQNYTGVNFHESAQYSNSASKTFAVWLLKSKNAMPLINFHTCNFCKSQLFVKNTKIKYS